MERRLNIERVQWLERAWTAIREEILPDCPETACITVGFPSKRAGARTRKRLGECWYGWKNGEGYFISLHPCLFPDPVEVLSVMTHEMVHATVGPKCGHRGAFVGRAREVGLEGKPTSTRAGAVLTRRLNTIAERLGPLPPGEGDTNHAPKQTSRLRKYFCPKCKQIIRAATDVLEALHVPCSTRFVLED